MMVMKVVVVRVMMMMQHEAPRIPLSRVQAGDGPSLSLSLPLPLIPHGGTVQRFSALSLDAVECSVGGLCAVPVPVCARFV
jgi:hypothetical protein